MLQGDETPRGGGGSASSTLPWVHRGAKGNIQILPTTIIVEIILLPLGYLLPISFLIIYLQVYVQADVENQLLLSDEEKHIGETESSGFGLTDAPALLMAGYDPERVLCIAARQRGEWE